MKKPHGLPILLACAMLAPVSLIAADSPAKSLLDRSIAWHDPNTEWPEFRHTLELREVRPDGTERRSVVTLDSYGDPFVLESTTDDITVKRALVNGECSTALNGETEISTADRTKYRLACEKVKGYRNYYLFLWGLPMKLRDPGTRIDPEITPTTFEGDEVLSVRVTFDPEVGGDTWYFYFETKTARLVGCRFYHDESKNDGEYIVFDDEYELGPMRLPNGRRWYTNDDGRHLGTDRVVSHK